MGKIFPQVTNLKASPWAYEKTLKLIESSFNYQAPYSFEKDFAPLIDPANHHNCFILIDENQNVLAHLGAKERQINIGEKKFTITLLGGIAVDEKFRGEGHFQLLMNDVLSEKRDETSFFILWSNLEKLYNKFGFYLCGNQFELSHGSLNKKFKKTTYAQLNENDKQAIHKLYEESFAQIYLTINRTSRDWEQVAKITSADLYINEENERITDYFFMNKGQDLTNIVYEYGSSTDIKQLIKDASGYGKVWMGTDLSEIEESQFQFFLSPGETKKFSQFIEAYTNSEISIREINLIKQEVFFNYKDELLLVELPEFLCGIFGPGQFEELKLPSLFISGLDSV